MNAYTELKKKLLVRPKTWLITGVAGFIGSNLLEELLQLNQFVVGIDDFSTGFPRNLELVKSGLTVEQWDRFKFIEGDIRELDLLDKLMVGVDYVLHQAAIGSVPRSIENPFYTNSVNVEGSLNVFWLAGKHRPNKVVYASSSSVYGDSEAAPKSEDKLGQPLSPYAVSKRTVELYASAFSKSFGVSSIGLRYFNVFGQRQNPEGAYSAVIPRWINIMVAGGDVDINGDGSTSRDFTHIDNVVQANLLTACMDYKGQAVFNVACGGEVSLNELFSSLEESLGNVGIVYKANKNFKNFRTGDIKRSIADISKISEIAGYSVITTFKIGIEKTVKWYLKALNV